MAVELRWWGIPGAMLVMTGVLTLGDGDARRVDRAPAASPAADVAGPAVRVEDASGPRRLRLPLSEAGLDVAPLWLRFPPQFCGERIDLVLWRRLDGRREARPWLNIRPQVRADGTLPMSGIVPGRYDLQVVRDGRPPLLLEDVASPGEVDLAAATPVR